MTASPPEAKPLCTDPALDSARRRRGALARLDRPCAGIAVAFLALCRLLEHGFVMPSRGLPLPLAVESFAPMYVWLSPGLLLYRSLTTAHPPYSAHSLSAVP